MQVPVHTVQVFLTTHCNMRCPDCCCAMQVIPKKDKYFVDWDYILNAAKYLKGVETISLMGGEPTMHPKFEEFVPKIKELFDCKNLRVETNGTMFKKFPHIFKYFDSIYVTRYHKDMYEGCPDNLDDINFLKEYLKDSHTHIWVNDIEHKPRVMQGTKPCFRAYSGGISYEGGKLYPCVAGSGIVENKVNINLTENWREEIKTILPPCSSCLFAEI